MNTLYTSDSHYFHSNILGYCDRPFKDVLEMNRTIVERWNSVVSPEDTVYHLGDFAFGKYYHIHEILMQLNGKITLVIGNHDRSINAMKRAGFADVRKWMLIEDDGVKLFLSHKPEIRDAFIQEQRELADFHLCGHVHTAWKRHGDTINVGVDQWDFTPRTIEELLDGTKNEMSLKNL